jgi:hypothetical protein
VRAALLALALGALVSAPAAATCQPGADVSVAKVVERIASERRRYVFVGERHGSEATKDFAVDLANALAARGLDVGLYVEGFRTDCAPRDAACGSLARLFNPKAFQRLLAEARVPVHAIDPPEKDARAARMAATIASGGEEIRVVLVGRTHVVHAGDPLAELWVYGGGMRYRDPGDVVEAFPAAESLTVALEVGRRAAGSGPGYALHTPGCGADYALLAP